MNMKVLIVVVAVGLFGFMTVPLFVACSKTPTTKAEDAHLADMRAKVADLKPQDIVRLKDGSYKIVARVWESRIGLYSVLSDMPMNYSIDDAAKAVEQIYRHEDRGFWQSGLEAYVGQYFDTNSVYH